MKFCLFHQLIGWEIILTRFAIHDESATRKTCLSCCQTLSLSGRELISGGCPSHGEYSKHICALPFKVLSSAVISSVFESAKAHNDRVGEPPMSHPVNPFYLDIRSRSMSFDDPRAVVYCEKSDCFSKFLKFVFK